MKTAPGQSEFVLHGMYAAPHLAEPSVVLPEYFKGAEMKQAGLLSEMSQD
jgi:hypothetical protein